MNQPSFKDYITEEQLMELRVDEICDECAFHKKCAKYKQCQELKERVKVLESELLEIINVLLKVSPKHEEWINMNFPYYKGGEK